MLKKLGQLFFQRGIIAQFYLRMNNLAGECVMRNYTKRELAGFVVPSVVGIFLFMIPIRFHGEWTIIVKIIADYIGAWLGGFLPLLCVIIVTVSAILGILSLKKPSFISSYPIIDNTFSTTPIWAIIRCVGAVFIWLTYLGVSAGEDSTGIIHMITESGAGGFVLSELLTVLVIIFLLANNTQIFEILGTPFLPLLKLLHVPEAAEASKTMIVGFTDMFTPSILAAGSISSPMTKFIVAVSSVTQLIYLSEVGGPILGSKIPVNIGELFLLFLERTIIGLLIGTAVVIVLAYNYHKVLTTAQIPGGAYGFVAKIFGRNHGFLVGWFLFLTYMAILWGNATALVLLMRYLFGNTLQFGFHYSLVGLL